MYNIYIHRHTYISLCKRITYIYTYITYIHIYYTIHIYTIPGLVSLIVSLNTKSQINKSNFNVVDYGIWRNLPYFNRRLHIYHMLY